MSWLIESKLKSRDLGWTAISVERMQGMEGMIRKYRYKTEAEARAAFRAYLDIEASFPNIIARLASGKPRFRELYDVRFVEILIDKGTPDENL